jgi:hypothetical protein
MAMNERWLEPSPEAASRRELSLTAWAEAATMRFASPEAREAYRERVAAMTDAIAMKRTPARIAVCPSAGHFPLEYAGVSWREAMYDYARLAGAWEKYYDDFAPDAYVGPATVVPGTPLEMIDVGFYRWAGHGLADDQEYQFVEREYMRAEEYRELIDDPTGFFLTTYLPRIAGGLTPLQKTPLLPPIHELLMIPPALAAFAAPDVQAVLQSLARAGEESARWLGALGRLKASIVGRGFPPGGGGVSKAPFDALGDTLRGTRGVLLDMRRHPDELLEACERLVPFMVKYGIATCQATGHPVVFMPLHKGADGFMSDRQFRTFYWPSLRKVIIGLIDAGLVPQLFAEGGYNERLDVISDLPKGTTIWWLDRTDMARAKDTVGRVACLWGNVPLDVLCTGTTDDVTRCCRTLIDTAGRDGGFILSTGAGIQGSKPANVKAMIDFSREYGVYR